MGGSVMHTVLTANPALEGQARMRQIFCHANRPSARGHRQDVEWILQARGSDATAKVGGAFLENENGRLLSHYSCHHTSRIR